MIRGLKFKFAWQIPGRAGWSLGRQQYCFRDADRENRELFWTAHGKDFLA